MAGPPEDSTHEDPVASELDREIEALRAQGIFPNLCATLGCSDAAQLKHYERNAQSRQPPSSPPAPPRPSSRVSAPPNPSPPHQPPHPPTSIRYNKPSSHNPKPSSPTTKNASTAPAPASPPSRSKILTPVPSTVVPSSVSASKLLRVENSSGRTTSS
jgi:hypothetical protein